MLRKSAFAAGAASVALASLTFMGGQAFADDAPVSDPDPATTASPDPNSGGQLPGGPIDCGQICEDSSGNPVIYYGGANTPKPLLTQHSSHGVVTLTVTATEGLVGKSFVFFAKDAHVRGGVIPLGAAKVGSHGRAVRIEHIRQGYKVAAYAKLIGPAAAHVADPYSNLAAFVVQ